MGPDRRLKFFIYARILVSFLFLAFTLLLNYKEPASSEDLFQSGIVRLMAFSFIFSAVSHFVFRYEKFRFFIIYLQSIWDVLFVTVLLLFTGGIASPYSFLYLLSIMNAGVLLGRREAFYTASLCGILYGAIVDFQYFGMLESIGLLQADARQFGSSHLFYAIFLNLMGFLLTAFTTGLLAERARESEAALREKVINLEELAQLNTMIVSNIETGLITTNTSGNIRVYNPYAESLTGISQVDAYDAHIGSIFPGLSQLNQTVVDTISDEFTYTTHDGLQMIFGYSAVPFMDSHGAPAGTIINFRDMTAIRRMEEALNRADRMAALGELSARMAHEIRNPLAAMSGSVQVLAEQCMLADSDRKLLAIVVRESDRLNKLITEFLAYARPTSPHKVSLDLKALIDDISLLLSADSRFNSIQVVNQISPSMTIQADSGQIRQVMINLFRNAADAMPGGGRIEIESRFLLSGADGFRKAPVVVITVSDTGTGIDSDTATHLFEPFWTTKSDGTGLGLAISYRIIEAHGGAISVDSPSIGGSRFTILLPV
jgi:two-component system sensor histidine kinase PilS (NtrC family)